MNARRFLPGNPARERGDRTAARRRSIPAFTRRAALLAALFLQIGAPGPNFLQGGEPPPPAPAVNWVLPLFTEKEGHRSMTLRGSEVRPIGRSIAVTDLHITIFSGDASAQVDTVLLSSDAVFSPKENLARGDKGVRLIRDDVDVTGVGWTYDHTTKKVSLQHNVRVTFRAQLNDILK
jgi:hypothetical protein